MINIKINQEVKNFSSLNGVDEAFLPIFISKYLKLNKSCPKLQRKFSKLSR